MAERQVRVKIGAAFASGFKQVFDSSENRLKKLTQSVRAMDQTSKDISGVDGLVEKTKGARMAWGKAKVELSRLNKEVKASQKPTKKLLAQQERAKKIFDRTGEAVRKSRSQLGGLQQSLRQAGVDTRNLSSEQKKLAASLDRVKAKKASLDRFIQTRRANQNARSGALGSIMGLGATAVSFGLPAKIAIDFQHSMKRVQALANATQPEIKALEARIKELGNATQFTASQTAEAAGFLAMAGLRADRIKDSLGGVLDLAIAGGSDLAATADIASNIMSGFSLKAKDMSRVGDTLAATFTSANVDLVMLGETMKFVAPVASALGAGIEEVAAISGLLGNVGIQGSMAGTSIRSMYQRLASPPKEAQKALSELGIATKDAQNNLRPMPELLKDFHHALKGVGSADASDLIKRSFGVEASAAATEAIKQAGSGELDFRIKKLELAPVFRDAVSRLNREGKDKVSIAELLGLKGAKNADLMSEVQKKIGSSTNKRAAIKSLFKLAPQHRIDKDQLDLGNTKAREQLKKLGVPLFENGKRRTDKEITGGIENKLGGVTEEKRELIIKTLFKKDPALDNLMKLFVGGNKFDFKIDDEFGLKVKGRFKDLAKELDKTNSAGKVAEEMSKTTKSALQRLGSAAESAGNAIGSTILPHISDLAEFLSKGATQLAAFADKNEGVTRAVLGTTAGLVGLKAASLGYMLVKSTMSDGINLLRRGFDILTPSVLKNGKAQGLARVKTLALAAATKIAAVATSGWALAQKAVNLAMTISPIGRVIAGVIALGAGAVLLWKNWDKVKSTLLEFWKMVKPAFAKGFEVIKKVFEFSPLGQVIKHWEPIRKYLSNFWPSIKIPSMDTLIPKAVNVAAVVTTSLPQAGLANLRVPEIKTKSSISSGQPAQRLKTSRGAWINVQVKPNIYVGTAAAGKKPEDLAEMIADEVEAKVGQAMEKTREDLDSAYVDFGD